MMLGVKKQPQNLVKIHFIQVKLRGKKGQIQFLVAITRRHFLCRHKMMMMLC